MEDGRKIINTHQARPSPRLIGSLWGIILLIIGLILLLASAVVFNSHFKGFNGWNDSKIGNSQAETAEDNEGKIKRAKIFVFCSGTTLSVAAIQILCSLGIICREPVKNKPNTGSASIYALGIILVISALICVIYHGYISVRNLLEEDVEKNMWVFASVGEVIVCFLGWMIARVFDKEYIGIDITPAGIESEECVGLTPEEMRALYR